jgi:pimeloyl-ACP methyl ester carboxylesterase
MAERIVYLHGVPQSGAMWQPFTERTGGDAPDLPGFGSSDKPASGDYTFRGLGRWVSDCTRDIERFSLVVHDWGSVGLLAAMERPEAIERLVIINAVPFLPGYRWHRTARMWRTPLLGELSMGSINRRVLRLISRESNATPGPMPDAWIDSVLAHFDQGTQRAILRLYRSSPPERLAAAGERLGELGVPSLVVWGMRDPYIPARFGEAYADVLGGELLELADAGHWAWIDRPDAIDRVVEFLGGASG